MAELITWGFVRSRLRYVFKMTNGRKKLVRTIGRVLRLEEPILREVVRQEVPIANHCEETQRLFRVLKRKFEEPEQDEEEGNSMVVSWTFHQALKRVEVFWDDGDSTFYRVVDLLSVLDVHFLDRILQVSPNMPNPSQAFRKLQDDIRGRVGALHYWYEDADEEGGIVEDGEDPDDDDYLSEEMSDYEA